MNSVLRIVLRGLGMSLRVTCPGCRVVLTVAPEMAGRSLRCTQCQMVFRADDTATSSSLSGTRLQSAAPKPNPALPADERAISRVGEPRRGELPSKKSSPVMWIVLAVVAVIGLPVLVCFGLVGVFVARDAKPVNHYPPMAENVPRVPQPMAPEPAAAPDVLSREALDRLKSSTVLVTMDTERGPAARGSGFLIKVDDKHAYVATTDHVVEPENFERKSGDIGGSPKSSQKRISVVFHSGTPQEMEVRAFLVQADAERDLAILRLANNGALPKPIVLAGGAELFEKMPVFVLGFPAGEAKESGRNSAVTVGTASISGFRRNFEGRIVAIQVQGDLNVGSSGGPVVDGQGRLVGIAVSRERKRPDENQAGLVIPGSELEEMLKLGASVAFGR